MKNILNIEDGTAILLSNVNDGTNTIFINGAEIPASSWVGSGVYQFTESGVTFTIQKIDANTGNIMLQLVSGTTYTLLKCLDSDSFGSGVYFGTCTTAAATAAKEVTLTNTNAIELKAGIIVGVKFSNSNTASNVTLNVNGTGAKSIYYNNAVYTGSANSVCGYANRTYFYMYDGTYWVFLSQGITDSNTYTSAYCSTAAGTAAKTASCSGYNLLANSYIHIIMTTANTSAGALTLNINGKGAKPIYINGAASSSTNYSLPAGSYLVYYDGTNYYFRTDGKVTSAGIVDIGGNTGKYAKGDGTWGTPTNTTYTFATGDANGQIKVTPSGGTAQNVSVKGLGSAAYTASTAYAVSKELTNENLNNVTTPGFYNAGGSNTCANKPDAVGAFGLEVVHTAAGSYYLQIINPSGTSDFYRRVCNNGTWGAWTKEVLNNLTSDSTTESLSAAQGKALANGSARDSTKLPLAGGTMTGRILRNITSGTSYINGPAGTGSLLHMNKSEGNIYYALASLRTKGGGGWAIGNYSGENLEFTYGTKENITSGTNTTSNVVLRNIAGTIALTSEVSAKVAKSGDTMSGNLTIDRQNGTAGSVAWSYLMAGNNIATSADKNSTGVLRLFSGGTSYVDVAPATTNSPITQMLQAKAGTIALTSDISGTRKYTPLITSALTIAPGEIATVTGVSSATYPLIEIWSYAKDGIRMSTILPIGNCNFPVVKEDHTIGYANIKLGTGNVLIISNNSSNPTLHITHLYGVSIN